MQYFFNCYYLSHPGRDCLDLLYHGFNTSGLYYVDPDGNGAFQVFCDQETSGGGWVVFQRRINGTVAFADRDWNQYKTGFGNLSYEFWLGNEKLRRLTSMAQQLLVELEDYAGEKAHASHNSFTILKESAKYQLELGEYSGTAGNSLIQHGGMKFSTIDQDNDPSTEKHCASLYRGGWWYSGGCRFGFLNGRYVPPPWGMLWRSWKGYIQLKHSEMKIRTLRGK